jgi:hypothetical protein
MRLRRFVSITIIILLFAFIFTRSCRKGEDGSKTEPERSGGYTALPTWFKPEDAVVDDVYLDMDLHEVVALLGPPLSVQSVFDPARGADRHIYAYSFGTVAFRPKDGNDGNRYVSRIIVTEPGTSGPRASRVGDNIDFILAKFPQTGTVNRKSTDENGNESEVIGVYEPYEVMREIIRDTKGKIIYVEYIWKPTGSESIWFKMDVDGGLVVSIDVGTKA